MPPDCGRDQLRVEPWVWPVRNEPRLLGPLHAQLNMKLLAFRILWPHRLEEPGGIVRITELISAIGPDEPLITTLFNFHVFCNELLNTFADPETHICQQKL